MFKLIGRVSMAKSVAKKITKKTSNKYVYFFGAGKADGKAEMKNLLGGDHLRASRAGYSGGLVAARGGARR